jgi:hypothetical protein
MAKLEQSLIPRHVDGITVELLDEVVSEMHPGASVVGFELLEAKGLGKMVSTAGRLRLRLRYGPGSPALPEQVIVKMVIEEAAVPGVLYETEVMMYRNILPELDIERPLCLGARYDPATENFILILEDLSVQGAYFPNVLEPAFEPERVGQLLDLLAGIHARYWRSPRLEEEREWLSSFVEGRQFDFFDGETPVRIDDLVAGSTYRQDVIERVGRSPAELWAGVKAVHAHQHRTLPPTLQHGDTGAHNTYFLPDGRFGFLDWQLSLRAPWPHDVHYLVVTALSVKDRRRHERALVERYLRRLAELGVSEIPSLDDAMREFGRSIIWGFTIGWLMAPERNYGMEIISANIERLLAAAIDHGTFALADEVMDGG